MKEAIGSSYIFWMVIFFVGLFIVFFASSLNYTKAFKAKNRIVEILEKYDDVLNEKASICGAEGECTLSTVVDEEISDNLYEMGYRISSNPDECEIPERFDGAFIVNKISTNNYEYCIYGTNTDKGTYYGVKTYVYFEIPIIAVKLKFPVYGETKINGILGNGGN